MIAFTRYEGMIFMVVPFVISQYLFFVLKKKPAMGLGNAIVALPFFFIFCQLAYVFDNPVFLQLETFGKSSAFALSNVPENLGAFFDMILTSDRTQANSLLLGVIGLTSLPIGLLLVIEDLRKRNFDSASFKESLFIIVSAITAILFLCLIFLYHWGKMNAYETARFTLYPFFVFTICILFAWQRAPKLFLGLAVLASFGLVWQTLVIDGGFLSFTILYIVIGILTGAYFVIWRGKTSQTELGVMVFLSIFLISETLPAIDQRRYEQDGIPFKRAEIFQSWIREYGTSNAFFVSESPFYGIVLKKPMTSLQNFQTTSGLIMRLKEERKISDVFILQALNFYPDGSARVSDKWKAPEEFILEPVEWERIDGRAAVRMMRVIGKRPVKPENASEEPASSEDQGDGSTPEE
jgi:hypothetical protein